MNAYASAIALEVHQIAMLPKVAIQVTQTVADVKSSAQDLVALVSNDTPLCSRILRLANSAFYGLPGQITTIDRAVTLLGMNTVRDIALASSLTRLVGSEKLTDTHGAPGLWRHSVAVATAASRLAQSSGYKPVGEAFLCGLMHDVGLLVEVQVRKLGLTHALMKVEGDEVATLREAEQAELGTDHEQVGSALCDAWRMPDSITQSAGFHHRPLDADPAERRIVSIVHAADILAAQHALGWTITVETETVDDAALDEARLTREQLDEAGEDLAEATTDAIRLFREAA